MSILVFAHEIATLVKQHQDAGVETQEIVHVLEEVVGVLIEQVQTRKRGRVLLVGDAAWFVLEGEDA